MTSWLSRGLTELPELDYDHRYKEPQTIRAGRSLILDVSYTGVPAPKAEWYFNEQPVMRSAKTDVSSSDSHTTFSLKDISRDDAGTYKVKVTNKAGSKTSSFEVRVIGEFTSAFAAWQYKS